MIPIFRRRRRIVSPLVSLAVAGAIYLATDRFDSDSFRESSRQRRGSGLYVLGHRVSFGGDRTEDGPSKPVSNPWLDRSSERVDPEAEPFAGTWPPVINRTYPDLNLVDQNGERFRLSRLRGKVILLEIAAVPCAGCQAFAGGNKRGGFGGVSVQKGLDSIHEYARRYGGIDLDRDKNVAFVQLLLYGRSMSNPTQDEVSGWARHFGMARGKNHIVLRGERSMINRQTYNMIPGFHLIDRDFVLRVDSSGHQPTHDLYRELLPALGKMAR